jgi:hypothetical protein
MKLASLSLLALAAFAGPAQATRTVYDTGNGTRTTVYDDYAEWMGALHGAEPAVEDFADTDLVEGMAVEDPRWIRNGAAQAPLLYGVLGMSFSFDGASAIGFDYADTGAVDGVGFNLFAYLSDDSGFSYRPTASSGFIGMITNRAVTHLTLTGRSGYGYRTMTVDTMRLANAAVPEPAGWAMMVGGFGLIGGALRSGRRRPHAVA